MLSRFLKLKKMLCALIFIVFNAFSYVFAFGDTEVERTEKIKIAYLFHFSQFTEWAIKPPVFTYCVYENSHFSALLKQAYDGKTLGTSQIDVQDVNATSTFDSCQLLYFPGNVPADLLASIRKKPILTVGEQKNILDQGIIYLFEDNQKIRFFINNTQALSVSLKINSQLLSLSKEPLP
jgi:hypothetical protein